MPQSHRFLRTYGAGFRFDRQFGLGIEFDSSFRGETVRLRSVYPQDPAIPREADLRLSSFVGTSSNAVHWYVRISFDYPIYVKVSDGERWPYGASGDDLPLGSTHLELEITRLVDRRDLKHDKDTHELDGDPLSMGRMKPGEYTHGFWSEEEAIQGAIAFFKGHFAEGWILVPDSWDADLPERPIYASTVEGAEK